MAADGGDQEHQHGGMRDRLEREAVEEQSDRSDDGERQRDVDCDRRMAAAEPHGQCQHDRGQHNVDREGADDQACVQRAPRHKQVKGERRDAHDDRELGGARHLPRRQRGIGQRAIGDELALRNQDHARHREHQHQRQPEQRVDRAVGDAVLDQEQHDRGVQERTLPPDIASRRRRAGPPIAAVEMHRRRLVWWITIIEYNLKAGAAGGRG